MQTGKELQKIRKPDWAAMEEKLARWVDTVSSAGGTVTQALIAAKALKYAKEADPQTKFDASG